MFIAAFAQKCQIESKHFKVYANRDTATFARLVQKWREPTNPVMQGRLSPHYADKEVNFRMVTTKKTRKSH